MKKHSAGQIVTDEEIVARIKNGETSLFPELFHEYYEKLKPILLSKHGNISVDDAEDIVSATLRKAFENPNKYDSKKALFNTWVGAILENCATDWFRKNKRSLAEVKIISEDSDYEQTVQESSLKGPGIAELDVLFVHEIRNAIIESVLKIESGHLRALFIMRFVLLLTNEQVAEIIGIKQRSVCSDLSRLMGEVESNFRCIYPGLRDIDYECMATVIRNGELSVSSEDVGRVTDKTAKKIIHDIAIKGIPFSEAVKSAGVSSKKASELMINGVQAVIHKKMRAAMKLSRENTVKTFTDMVTAAFEPARPETINMIILNEASKRSTPLDRAARLLCISIHELGALLTQTVPLKLKDDQNFIKRLAQFIGKTITETKRLVETAKPPVIAFQTLRKPGRHDFASRLEKEIKSRMDLKYGISKNPK
jgi:RNA polymerase sigma factor (sigma-70 family)